MLNIHAVSRRRAAMMSAAGMSVLIPAFADSKSDPGASSAVRAVFKEHDRAFTDQDLKGVLATLNPDAILIGTSPGEIWKGHSEISDAYRHFFSDFDRGKQSFDVLWSDSGVSGDMAWFLSENKVTMNHAGKKSEFGLNLSVTLEKAGDAWLIRTMHFSNLVGGSRSKG